MSELRVVCVGANLESEIALQALLDADVSVVGLVTLPARSVSGVSDYRDLHSLCEGAGVSVVDTADINSPEACEAIAALEPDYIFVLGWSQIFRKALLQIPTHGVIGSHPTPLPERRGRAPIPWTILEGHRQSAVTLFRMSPGVDDGPIVYQEGFVLPERPYAMEAYRIVANTLASGFVSLYRRLSRNAVSERAQEGFGSYRARRSPADGHIDFSRKAEHVDRLVRAVSEPFPGAYTYFEDQRVSVWRADPYRGVERRGVPGQVLAREGDWLVVQAGDHPVCLAEFQTEGVPVPAGYFPLGSTFGYRVEDSLADLRRRVASLEQQWGEG